jgi:UPF0042 nucleotide-binding protein
MGIHDLREVVLKRVERRTSGRLSVTLESFGFKHGLPGDADFVLDTRTLPNPYWDPALRSLTGRDPAVVKYLEGQAAAKRMVDEFATFIEARIAEHQAANRRYLTVAVGCTGGQHRSVYVVDRLAERLAPRYPDFVARHTALPVNGPAGDAGSASAPEA